MNYIDLHTHKKEEKDHLQIRNVFAQDLSSAIPEGLFSAGLHPWHIENVNPEDCFQALEEVSKLNNMLSVGECGIDRSISIAFAVQESYFKDQIRIAEKYSKPLIIHCVRAYSDLIRIKKETKSRVPWIIHAYRGNEQTTQGLIAHGFYFSIGKPALRTISGNPALRIIPIERLFLETDDEDISIEEVYGLASQALNMDEEILGLNIFSNFVNLFGTEVI